MQASGSRPTEAHPRVAPNAAHRSWALMNLQRKPFCTAFIKMPEASLVLPTGVGPINTGFSCLATNVELGGSADLLAIHAGLFRAGLTSSLGKWTGFCFQQDRNARR